MARPMLGMLPTLGCLNFQTLMIKCRVSTSCVAVAVLLSAKSSAIVLNFDDPDRGPATSLIFEGLTITAFDDVVATASGKGLGVGANASVDRTLSYSAGQTGANRDSG